MPICSCRSRSVLLGTEAESYSDRYLTYVTDHQGWTQLWKCPECGTYWEMSWEGGLGSFDDGVMTLRKLSSSELRERWPEVSSTG